MATLRRRFAASILISASSPLARQQYWESRTPGPADPFDGHDSGKAGTGFSEKRSCSRKGQGSGGEQSASSRVLKRRADPSPWLQSR